MQIFKKIKSTEIILLGLIISLTFVFTYPVIFKMNTVVYGPIYNTDNRASPWFYWCFKYALTHHQDLRQNNMIVHPFGVKNILPSLLPFCQVPLKLFTILVNEIFAYNLILLLSFILSGLTMYCLSFYLTKNRLASLVVGIIYGFCPYHFNKAFEHYTLALIEWMPLYILLLLLLRQKWSIGHCLMAALALVMVVLSEPHYGYMMSVFTFCFAVFILLKGWREKIASKELIFRDLKVIGRIFIMTAISICIIFIAVYPLVIKAFNPHPKSADFLSTELHSRPLKYLFSQSARPLSYLLPASTHPIFGGFTKSMFGSFLYGRNSIEQTLYLGWVPLILAFAAFKYRKKNKALREARGERRETDNVNFYIELFSFSALVAFLFSFPPYINLGLFKIYFPSYFMHKILPMFRAYARFGILVMLCVSVLAGFGLKFILEKIKTSRTKVVFTFFISCLVLFEFTTIPPFHATDLSKNIPEVYSWLKDQKGDLVIAEYPLGESGIGETYINLDYLLYQRIHQKRLINGAVPGTYAFKIRDKILRITDPGVPSALSWLGVKYVILHLEVYKSGMDRLASDVIGEVPDLKKFNGFKLVRQFKDTEVYEITAKPEKVRIE
ncbi:MAG: hypothetical protein V1674_07485 [Candidatus Omnitrophota bacterium]